MTNPENGFPANAQTMLAIVEAMHTLTAAIATVLTPEQQNGMALALALRAKKAEEAGDAVLETLLIDLYRTVNP